MTSPGSSASSHHAAVDMRGDSDEQLLAAFAKGDRSALEELARRHEVRLLGLCSGVLGGRRDLAMDAVQETWLRVVRFARNFKGSSSVKTWLYRIAINQCRTLHGKVSRDVKRSGSMNDGVARADVDAAADPQCGLDPDVRRQVREAVSKLDIGRRTLVLLCYHAGMTHQQAASILGIPLGTLKSRLHATLTHLRQTLPEEVRT
jgi:RNA polymerase sigma-70 factor (ECF subfamily)